MLKVGKNLNAMRKIVLVLIVGIGVWLYLRQRDPTGHPKLEIPSRLAWKHYPFVYRGNVPEPLFVEVVAIDHGKWRTEILWRGKRILVVVCDGVHTVCYPPTANPQSLDPTVAIRQLYGGLKTSAITSTEFIEGSNCWHFAKTTADARGDVWVDHDTGFLRRVVMQHNNGGKKQDDYEILSIPIDTTRAFDTRNLVPLFEKELAKPKTISTQGE